MSADQLVDLTDLQGVVPLTYQQANQVLNRLALARRDAIRELDQAQAAEAEWERQYRKAVATAWRG